jgi:hypothetical protein
MIMALTDTKIKQLKPAEKDYKESDEKGMYLLVRATGSKLWRMKYRVAGVEKTLSIGAYPDVTLKEARELRDKARADLAKGIDPSEVKKAAKVTLSGADSFAAIITGVSDNNWGQSKVKLVADAVTA